MKKPIPKDRSGLGEFLGLLYQFPIRSPSKRTVVIICSQKGQREFSACTWFQLTAQFASKAEDLEAIGRDTTQAIEYENGKV